MVELKLNIWCYKFIFYIMSTENRELFEKYQHKSSNKILIEVDPTITAGLYKEYEKWRTEKGRLFKKGKKRKQPFYFVTKNEKKRVKDKNQEWMKSKHYKCA